MRTDNWLEQKKLFHAALDLSPEQRASFLADACNGDEELRNQVEKLLAAHDESGPFLVSPAVLSARGDGAQFQSSDSAERTGQRIGPYEIIREIGHGGMGTVYLAVRADDHYRKQVAIKLINRGMDTDLILRRFMMERQILANLEHPNIAHLLEGGSTPEGLPYFVMEYVDGEAITSYCDAKQFNFGQRLELFREVCSALQYAHQNLVVHRDIKPSNILVTAQGVPKLLDFGIAKLLSPHWAADVSEATASMVRLMTPRYASPEQLRGLSITTASDVYSLGLVLYELLSGHHPYRASSGHPEEIAEMILREEPEKPSTAANRPRADDANPTAIQQSATDNGASNKANSKSETRNPKSLRGDLDNIVLKALRQEPERRYASVQEFSEDIRRHLEGLPVIASPDTFSYRAGKFVRRNTTAVVAAAIVIITMLSATGVTAWQARVARRERDKAQSRFNDVRQLANSVVFELQDSIQNLPGSTPSRELLVTRALEYLDKLALEAGHDPSLQLELAAAYDKIGDIQGGYGASHLGQREKAAESYRKGLAIREALVNQDPNNLDYKRKLVTSYTKLGEMMWIGVDVDGALGFYDKALAMNLRLADKLPEDTQFRIELAKSYQNVGYMHGVKGRTDQSLKNLREAVALLEQLDAGSPNDSKIQYELALSYDNLALILTDLAKSHSEALGLFRKSQKIGETLLAADPQNTKLRRGKAVGDFNLAQVSARLGDTKTGLESSSRALAIFKDISSADPQNEDYKQAVAMAQTFVCEMMIKSGKAAEAIKLLTESLAALEKSFAASPTDEIAHFRIALAEASLGQGYAALASDDKKSARIRLDYLREARSWFEKSQKIFKTFNDEGNLSGEDAAKFDLVNNEIKRCDASIARLTGK